MKKSFLIVLFAPLFVNNVSALTLEDGLELVFKENPSLQSVKNELNIKEQQKNQARAGFMPTVKANYSLEDRHVNNEGSASTDANPSTGSITLSQSLFNGGQNFASYKQAKYNQESADKNYLLQQQEIFKTAADAYLSVITAKQVLEFNTRQVNTSQEEMNRVRQRFNLGDITLPNLKEFEARLSGYIADKEASYGSLLTAQANFASIFGQEPKDLSWPTIYPTLPANLTEAINLAINNNPDVVQSKLLLKASNQGIKVSRAGFMPSVNAVASWSNNSNGYNSTDTNVTAYGIEASLPLFTGGKTLASYKQSKFEMLQAQDALNQKIRDIKSETTSAYNDVLVHEQRVKALKVSLDSFQVTTDAVEKQEQAGEASIIDVLDARDDDFNAKVNLQQAKQELLLANFRLLSSIGKFTYSDLVGVFSAESKNENTQEVPDSELE
jgi:outer membrane protein